MAVNIVKFLIGVVILYGVRLLQIKSLQEHQDVSDIVYAVFGFVSLSFLGLGYKRIIDIINAWRNK